MPGFRYDQFCPIARATEILGERWTLLVLRELFGGPRRFRDLRESLPGISSSVLSERLASLEARGLVARTLLPPPAGVTVYQLGEAGLALFPALRELARWGMRFLLPGFDADFVRADWIPMAYGALRRESAAPAVSLATWILDGEHEVRCVLRGGPDGTELLGDCDVPVEATLRGSPQDLLRLASGTVPLAEAERSGAVHVSGDRAAAIRFPELFEIELGSAFDAPRTPNQNPGD